MGRKAVALQADLLDEAQTQALLPRAAEALGGPITVSGQQRLDLRVRHRCRPPRAHSWDRHLESNLRAPFVLTQALAAQGPRPAIDAAGEPLAHGLVVNMIDQRVRKLTPEFMTYTIAKMGLWALTRTAAQALAPAIRVNAIGPGPTLQGHAPERRRISRAQRAATVLKRGADPADITAALGYFLDAPAVTGQMLCVDGGQHLGWQTPDVLGVE